jgi:hypothetical protein
MTDAFAEFEMTGEATNDRLLVDMSLNKRFGIPVCFQRGRVHSCPDSQSRATWHLGSDETSILLGVIARGNSHWRLKYNAEGDTLF